jgi:branched-chain amino acid transport system permease protein
MNPPAKTAAPAQSADRYIFENRVKPRVTLEAIAAHRANPFGPHDPDLEIVLRYLQRDPNKAAPRYLLVATKPYEEYCIAEHSRVRGAPLTLTDARFATEEEAQHAIFLRRLRSLGDDDITAVLDQAAAK